MQRYKNTPIHQFKASLPSSHHNHKRGQLVLAGKIIGTISQLEVAATKIKNTQWKFLIIDAPDSPVAPLKLVKGLSKPVVATKLDRILSKPGAAILSGEISP